MTMKQLCKSWLQKVLGDKCEWPDGGIGKLMFPLDATAFRRAWDGKCLVAQAVQNMYNIEQECRDLIASFYIER